MIIRKGLSLATAKYNKITIHYIKGFHHTGLKVWNSIPNEVREPPWLYQFKFKNQDAPSCLETFRDSDDDADDNDGDYCDSCKNDGEHDDSDDYGEKDDGDNSDSGGDNGGDIDNKKCDKRKNDDRDIGDFVKNCSKKSVGGHDPSTLCLNNFHFNSQYLGKSDTAKATAEGNQESVPTMANSFSELVDTISKLHQMLSIERGKSESLMLENFSLKVRNQELETQIEKILESQAKENKIPQTARQKALEIYSNLTNKAEQSRQEKGDKKNETPDNPESKATTQGLPNREKAPVQVQPTFQAQWDSYVKEKSKQYEQHLISKKVEELKTSNPKGNNKMIANCAETNSKANSDSSTTSKTKEITQNRKQKFRKAQSRLKLAAPFPSQKPTKLISKRVTNLMIRTKHNPGEKVQL